MSIEILPYAPADQAAEVRRMYVDAPHRRRGLGSLLLAHGEAF